MPLFNSSSNGDTEAASERIPILREGRLSSLSIPAAKKKTKRSFYRFLELFTGGIYAPDASTWDPIEILLNTEDEEERDTLTQRWTENRLKELSFVGVVAALLAGVLTSTGSWPSVLPPDTPKPWSVRTSWYCGIILSLFSILSAADQTIRLHRMSSHRDANRKIRRLLSKWDKRGIASSHERHLKPNTLQIYAWQLPVIFLTGATVCMIVGMFAHVWSAANVNDWKLWEGNQKMAVTFTIVGLTSIVIFFAGQVLLYSRSDEDDVE
ncbi:hypothetical protein M011DRAFT_476935 [Sporormia fimetaria CBS 119925]|uniref:Uncharacterized protein n=1 Tax=Sporormia fimetaria CBS 119925 TaxID=1340428 RepID=A0A6A6VF09_9PLEO|nr:hypothetical protein M011DRAFT_476935 [Sporormia fimetaria CBS 119925]